MRSQLLVLVLILVGFTTGCTKYHGLKVLEPKPGHPVNAYQVDSLEPVLAWEPSKRANATYDLVIYQEQKIPHPGWSRTKPVPGERVYYRENLSEAQHKVEEPLKPNTNYFWTVRERYNGSVSAWSSYSYTGYYCLASESYTNWLFNFRTPDK